MSESAQHPLVVIRTLVYNHAPFLHDYFRGILMQETTFPFVAIVHDDASTDGSADIIREYAEKHPDIIKPIYETENQYSKRNGSLKRIMEEACRFYGCKYQATCEGDDYWTDPHKLQRQVDWLESHPECTMVCTGAKIEIKGTVFSPEDCEFNCAHYKEDRNLSTAEIVSGGGLYIHTASLVYRKELRENYPEAAKKCHVGDYPLQIKAALDGTVRFLASESIVYRWGGENSWTTRNLTSTLSEKRLRGHQSEINMLDAFDAYSQGMYREVFRERQRTHISSLLYRHPKCRKQILANLGYFLEKERFPESAPHVKAGLWRQGLHMIHAFLCRPYAPIPDNSILWPAWIRFFIFRTPHQFSLGLGRHHFFSLYKNKRETFINICGKTLFRKSVTIPIRPLPLCSTCEDT